MSARDKLLGREPLWPGDDWLNLFQGPRLPSPVFWIGLAIGIGLGAWWF